MAGEFFAAVKGKGGGGAAGMSFDNGVTGRFVKPFGGELTFDYNLSTLASFSLETDQMRISLLGSLAYSNTVGPVG